MSKAHYDIYAGQVLDLARSLVIKNGGAAQAVNAGLSELGHQVLVSQPSTWKYYLHLAGEYHPTDPEITITSIDTLESVSFTKQTLAVHRATAVEYSLGSRAYLDLIALYPDHEDLIRGVVDPVDLIEAINAPDGKVLSWDHRLVEENEEDLIDAISLHCQRMMTRWNTEAYALVDELYVASQFAVTVSTLPGMIMNHRLSRCHTRQAHSFHIRQYLASTGKLEGYIDFLNRDQLLWLYRNVRYLLRNVGLQENLDLLIDRLLTRRGLPIAAWGMRHDLSRMPVELSPKIDFSRSELNNMRSAGVSNLTVEQLLDREQPMARSNSKIQREAEDEITEMMQVSQSDRLGTKVLESSMVDTRDASPFPLPVLLLNQWLDLAMRDRYPVRIRVGNPRTGGEYSLNSVEAFVVYVFAYHAGYGDRPTMIPPYVAHSVRKLPTPTVESVIGMTRAQDLPVDTVKALIGVLSPVAAQYLSTEQFHTSMRAVHEARLDQRLIEASVESIAGHGQASAVIEACYHDVRHDVASNTSYEDWFTQRGLDVAQLTPMESQLLAGDIFKTATGLDLAAARTLKQLQQAMVGLTARLSSYSVQLLASINDEPIQVVDFKSQRLGRIQQEAGYFSHSRAVTNVQVIREQLRGHTHITMDLEETGASYTPHLKAFHRQDVEVPLQIKQKRVPKIYYRLNLSRVGVVKAITPSNPALDRADLEGSGYLTQTLLPLTMAFDFNASTEYHLESDERQQLVARWDARPDPRYVTPIRLDVNWLPGFKKPLGDGWITGWLFSVEPLDHAFTDLEADEYVLDAIDRQSLRDLWRQNKPRLPKTS